jgi:hypothetical protein
MVSFPGEKHPRERGRLMAVVDWPSLDDRTVQTFELALRLYVRHSRSNRMSGWPDPVRAGPRFEEIKAGRLVNVRSFNEFLASASDMAGSLRREPAGTVTSEEAARLLGFSSGRHFRRVAASARLEPVVRAPGRATRWRRSDVERLASRRAA